MKNVKISSIIIAVSALFLAAGCSGLTSAVESRSSSGESTVTVSASCAPASSADAAVRSAYPSFDASGLYLTLTAESSGCAPVTVTADSKASASLVLIRGKTWTVTADFYKDSARTVKCLTGHTETTPSEVAVSLSISVAPVSSSSGTGSISLLLKNDAATVYTVTAQLLSGTASEPAALQKLDTDGKAIASTDTTTLPSYWKFAADSVAAGTYTYQFVLYDASGARTGFFFDAITVYSGMTTDTWYVGGTSVNAFGIKSYVAAAAASQIFYVSGTQGTDGQVLPTGSDTAGTGTFTAPYATLGKALAAVNAANDGTSAYTIVVDGTVTEAQPAASTQDAPSSCASLAVSKTMNLTVTSLSGSATVQAPEITTAQNAAALLYISLSSTASDGVSLALTLKDISVICPSAANIESGEGIFYSLASSSSLTLDGCSVISTADMVIPVYGNGAASLHVKGASKVLHYTGTAKTAVSTLGSIVMTSGPVTLDSTALSIAGAVNASVINVAQMPSEQVSVSPNFTDDYTPSAVFGTMCSGFTTDRFPLDSEVYYYDTDNCARKVQSFSYSAGTPLTAKITYGTTEQTVFSGTTTNSVSSQTLYASALDKNGQIYVVYAVAVVDTGYTCYLYTNGKEYTVGSIGYGGKLTLAALNDTAGSLLLFTGSGSYYLLTPATTADGTAYTATAYTFDSSYGNTTFTALAGYNDGTTQYVFCGYAGYSASGAAAPRLAAATLSGTTLTKKWDISVEPPAGSSYLGLSAAVAVNDMTVSAAGELYMLVSDSSDTGLREEYHARGGLFDVGNAVTLAANTAYTADGSSLVPVAYGWRNTVNSAAAGITISDGTTTYTMNVYAATTTYPDGSFLSPQRFLALTPKKITIADYGIYVSDVANAKYSKTRGTAVFTLDSSSLTFTGGTESNLYGEDGSGFTMATASV